MYKSLIVLFIPLLSLGQLIDQEHELLWEISGNGMTEKSYIFGSFHSNDKRLFKLSDSTYWALASAQTIALETDIFSLFEELDTRLTSVNVNYDNQGDPYVSNNEPTETYYGDEDGMPQFLDAFIQEYCLNSDKNFLALESTDFQLGLFTDLEFPELNRYWVQSIFNTKEDVIEIYLKGDIYKLDQLLKSSLSVYPDGYQKVIIDRNIGMANKLDSAMQLKPIFAAIGAGHLAGPKGVLNLFRSKGYSVRKVTSTYSEKPSLEKKSIINSRLNVTYIDTLNLHLTFPGKPFKKKGSIDDEFSVKFMYKELGQGNGYEVEIYPILEETSLEDLAKKFIASPSESPAQKVSLDNGGEGFEGIADSYDDGLSWVRILIGEDSFIILKSYGGNKFMNSGRAFRFFNNQWFD